MFFGTIGHAPALFVSVAYITRKNSFSYIGWNSLQQLRAEIAFSIQNVSHGWDKFFREVVLSDKSANTIREGDFYLREFIVHGHEDDGQRRILRENPLRARLHAGPYQPIDNRQVQMIPAQQPARFRHIRGLTAHCQIVLTIDQVLETHTQGLMVAYNQDFFVRALIRDRFDSSIIQSMPFRYQIDIFI